ncbi:MAG: DeoR/GlpR family DNA-binding transcription regulator [Flexilinea sp.]
MKNRIAIKALDYLENSNVIFIDAGSTLLSLTKLLVPIPHLAVITNSFTAVQELSDSGNMIYFIGGEVNSITQATSGFWSINELNTLKIDITFLGTSGFQSHNGPCTKIFSDAHFKKTVIENSSKTIVLADHTKFVTNAIVQYADWSEIDLLITDDGITQDLLEDYKKIVEIIVA